MYLSLLLCLPKKQEEKKEEKSSFAFLKNRI
jgi:hypothetical protein